MIYRYLFVGYSKDVHSVRCTQEPNYYVALACKDNMVFMYVEANEKTVNPDTLAEGELTPYPDGKKWQRANDIYHGSKPVSESQWKRKIENKEAFFTFNRLKPEKISSYIFYHFQNQEEHLGGGEQYGIIFSFFDMLIFYQERPEERETEQIEGILKTNHTKELNWGKLMEEHFVDSWHEIETLGTTEYITFS